MEISEGVIPANSSTPVAVRPDVDQMSASGRTATGVKRLSLSFPAVCLAPSPRIRALPRQNVIARGIQMRTRIHRLVRFSLRPNLDILQRRRNRSRGPRCEPLAPADDLLNSLHI